MNTRKWLFVTGAPRSGTTFVGRVLSLPREADYLHEPFNPAWGIPGVDRQFWYLNAGPDEAGHRRLVERVLACDFTPRTGALEHHPPWKRWLKHRIGARSAWAMRRARLNPFHTTLVIKDPIGCLLTEYLVENYPVTPIILVRHPLSVVSSVKRLGWVLNLDPIRRQPELVRDYFSDDRAFLEKERTGTVENTAALWRALNKVLLSQAARHPSWLVIRHEDLSADPVGHFRRMYRAAELPWSPRIERKIVGLTRPGNPAAAREGRVHAFKRDSAHIFEHTKKTLSVEQRRKVHSVTEDVACKLYTRESFELEFE